jgi:tetratricopeptide (TPR) repeat protein
MANSKRPPLAILGGILLTAGIVTAILLWPRTQTANPDSIEEQIAYARPDTAFLPIGELFYPFAVKQYLENASESTNKPLAVHYERKADSLLAARDSAGAIHWYKAALCAWPMSSTYAVLANLAELKGDFATAVGCIDVLLEHFTPANEEDKVRLQWRQISLLGLINSDESTARLGFQLWELLNELSRQGKLKATDRDRPELAKLKYNPIVMQFFMPTLAQNQDTTFEWFTSFSHYVPVARLPLRVPASKLNWLETPRSEEEMGAPDIQEKYMVKVYDYPSLFPFWFSEGWNRHRALRVLGRTEWNGFVVTVFIADTLRESMGTPPEFRPVYAFYTVHTSKGRLVDYKKVAWQYGEETADLEWKAPDQLVCTFYQRTLERPYDPEHHNLDNRVESIRPTRYVAYTLSPEGKILLESMPIEAISENE